MVLESARVSASVDSSSPFSPTRRIALPMGMPSFLHQPLASIINPESAMLVILRKQLQPFLLYTKNNLKWKSTICLQYI